MFLQKIQVNTSQLNKFIKNDCRIFDKETMKPDEYFLNKKIVRNENLILNPSSVDEIIPVGVAINKQQPVERPKSIILTNTSNNNFSKLNLADNAFEQPNDIELNNLELNDNIAANNFLKSKLTNTIKPENSIIVEDNRSIEEKAINVEVVENKAEFDNDGIVIEEPMSKDYEELSTHEQLIYDKRSFRTYLKEGIIREHRIINILFKKTLFHPLYIKVNKLIFELSMGLALNALMYTANYIDKRATANDKVIA
jgi:hypothetical protein